MIQVINESNTPYCSTMASIDTKKRLNPRSDRVSNKRRKFSPKVTIVVGKGDRKQIYLYQPNKMVKHNHSIHIKLVASLMHEKRNPFTLEFPDIDPSDWNLMMKHIDPSPPRLNLFDAVRLRELYEKYGFDEGAKMCAEIISKSIGESPKEPSFAPQTKTSIAAKN